MTNYLEFAIKIARKAGELLGSLQPSFRKAKTKSTTLDLVTKADCLSENLIINAIRKRFPNHQIISEEDTGSLPDFLISCSPDIMTWVIDPLDGTTNYSHQFPFYCVSIALVEGNKSRLGVVYNPNMDELFYASIGKGAYLNDKRLKVSNIRSLNKSLLATGFPYIIREKPDDTFTLFRHFCLNAQAIRRAGAAALDLCYLAAGRFDGFWERELKPWDTAAGMLIVTEAGGKVTDFKGNPYDLFKHKKILASNKYIHQQMINLLNNK